ncbi:MAG: alkaline phosphatase family protein [Candidatus Altiarchaeota archaeon]
MTVKPKYTKVLVLGIDGMDPRVVRELMAEGKLSNFKRLSEDGSFMNLSTSYPPHSPVAWTSIATGANPGRHNIFDFIRIDRERNLPVLSLSEPTAGLTGTSYRSYVRSDPFWRLISDAGLPTTVIRWPMIFPPEEVNGVLLSGLGVPDVRGLLSGYTVYITDGNYRSGDMSKVVKLVENDGLLEADLIGPKVRKSGEIVDVRTRIRFKLADDRSSAEIIVQDRAYPVKVGGWSDWVRVEFNAGLLKKVSGIFKAYLKRADPFELYVTSLQVDPENPVVAISYPKDYSKALAEEIGLYYTLGMPEETSALVDGVIDEKIFLEQVAQVEEERDAMFWQGFEDFKRSDNGVYAFVYDSSDRIQHIFWDEKALGGDGKLGVNPAVADYYVKKDKLIGEILNVVGEDTLLLIVSDHGFTSFEKAVSINTWLVENGFMTLSGEAKEGDDSALFKYVDWNRTKAYSLGFNSLYINAKGREKYGIVEDRQAVVGELISKLDTLTDPDTGAKVVNRAYRREEIYSGDYVEEAPDIIIGFNPGYRMAWENAVGGLSDNVIYANTKTWKGDHLVDPNFVPGVLFTNARLVGDSASQLDVTPTILDALGVRIPEGTDGRSLLR